MFAIIEIIRLIGDREVTCPAFCWPDTPNVFDWSILLQVNSILLLLPETKHLLFLLIRFLWYKRGHASTNHVALSSVMEKLTRHFHFYGFKMFSNVRWKKQPFPSISSIESKTKLHKVCKIIFGAGWMLVYFAIQCDHPNANYGLLTSCLGICVLSILISIARLVGPKSVGIDRSCLRFFAARGGWLWSIGILNGSQANPILSTVRSVVSDTCPGTTLKINGRSNRTN